MGPVREVAAARLRQSGDSTAALLKLEHSSLVVKHLHVHRETAPTAQNRGSKLGVSPIRAP